MLALGAEARAQLVERLRSRRGEIEQAALARVRSVSDPEEIASPEYREGLRTAVSAALDYGIEALGRSEDRPVPIPTALLSQARLAARNGVELDTVLRRYLAGHTLLDDFLVEEAEREAIGAPALKRLLRAEAAALDRLLAAVSEEYMREAKAAPSSPEERRARQVERLLAGEPLDTTELAYPFEGCHLSLVASGPGTQEAIKPLARELDARLLIVSREEEGQVLWAWLGSRRRLDPEEVMGKVPADMPSGFSLAIGEPGEGIAGWRLSHRQAVAAHAVALRGREPFVRYADVALLALAIQDELLATSLRELYLEPLAAMAGGGERLRETLRAYIATGANTSSTAAALGVDRRTVTRRIRTIEEALGHSLTTRVAEVEVALRLWEFEEPSLGRDGTKWDTASPDDPQSGQAPPLLP